MGFVTSIFPALTIRNAASLVADSVSPGEIAAIRGYGLGPVKGVAETGGDLFLSLSGVDVSFDGISAPLFYVQEKQVNAQVPYKMTGRASSFVLIDYEPKASISTTFTAVGTASPGIVYINNSDGTANSVTNRAKAGGFVAI